MLAIVLVVVVISNSKFLTDVPDCGELLVPHGSLNGTSTTCGTTRELTCDQCYIMWGNGLAVCESDETWTFESECVIKGKVFVIYSKPVVQQKLLKF